jgi:hypothetical protein
LSIIYTKKTSVYIYRNFSRWKSFWGVEKEFILPIILL